MAGGHVWQGVMCGRGSCMAGGGMHCSGHVWQGGIDAGGWVWWSMCMAGETATVADGTHSTGMHSFFLLH